MAWEVDATDWFRYPDEPFYRGDAPDGSPLVSLPAKFHPDRGDQWISPDYPRYAYPGLDVDYRMWGYDWDNRDLVWSFVSVPTTVNAPTINSVNGHISWVPDATEDGSDFDFTVRMTPGNGSPVDMVFTTQVRTAKFIFTDWGDGVDVPTGRGSEGLPYKSVRYAQEQEAVDGVGQVYIVRGGTSNEAYPYSTSAGTDGPTGSFSTNTFDTPILTRNYPGETVSNDCLRAGGSYVANCPGSVIYNLHAINVGNCGLGMIAGSGAVAKICSANDNNSAFGINPTGIRYVAGSLLFGCVGTNNIGDTGANAQDIMGFMDIGVGDALIIDCISSGPTSGVIKQACGMRTKHSANWDNATYQGEYKALFHRSVITNPLSSGFSALGIGAGETFRHGIIVFDGFPCGSRQTQIELNRPATLTQSLICALQGNLYCSNGSTDNTTMPFNTDRFKFLNDEFFTDSGFNPFKADFSTAPVPDTFAGFEFEESVFYADADSDIHTRVSGIDYSFSDMNVPVSGESDRTGGQNNTRVAKPATASKEAAGKLWTWVDATKTLTGVDL